MMGIPAMAHVGMDQSIPETTVLTPEILPHESINHSLSKQQIKTTQKWTQHQMERNTV